MSHSGMQTLFVYDDQSVKLEVAGVAILVQRDGLCASWVLGEQGFLSGVALDLGEHAIILTEPITP